MKIVREGNGLLTVSADKQLYSLQSGDLVVIGPQRIKSAQVTFWTEDDWNKEQEKAKKRMERESKKQASLSQDKKVEL
jgi:hypothetical protein